MSSYPWRRCVPGLDEIKDISHYCIRLVASARVNEAMNLLGRGRVRSLGAPV